MGKIISGQRETGFDFLADYIEEGKGYSVPPIQNEGGHYLPSAIISAINSITVRQESKTCQLTNTGGVNDRNPVLVIDDLSIPLNANVAVNEGDFYIDINGNITTS